MKHAESRETFAVAEQAVPPEGVLPLLADLEARGRFGMTLAWAPETVTVTAWERVDEPCYETGRSATYTGPGLAVGDDDHHFIAGTIRMCEKTSRVYRSAAYTGRIEVGEADPELLARLDTDPVPFDCDTLADDAEAIAGQVPEHPGPAERSVIYRGPFRYLVLDDGAVLRRGIPAAVAGAQAERLVAEGCAVASPFAAPPAPGFRELYGRYGPLFLAGRGGGRSSIRMPAFEALDAASPSIRERLAKMLDRGDAYFMLQGTDPAVGGCCPLPQVGEANQLVEAGLLHSWASPLSPECPVTAYAMAGEVGELRDGMPVFHTNELLRRTVRVLLG